MIILENSLGIKMNSVKRLLKNKETFCIMVNNEFTYNYIMEFLYEKEINWVSGELAISKKKDFFWFKNIATGTLINLYYSQLYRKYGLRVVIDNKENSYLDIIYF